MAETNLQLHQVKYKWHNNYQIVLDSPNKETTTITQCYSTQMRKPGATKMLDNFWPHYLNLQEIAGEFSGNFYWLQLSVIACEISRQPEMAKIYHN